MAKQTENGVKGDCEWDGKKPGKSRICCMEWGPEVFKEIEKYYYEHEGYINQHEEETIRCKNINIDYCIDFKNDIDRCGVKYVYGWCDENGDLIYIGQGEMNRVCSFGKHTRTESFMESASGNIYLYIFAKRLSKEAALEIERVLIQRSCVSGVMLTNVREKISKEIVYYFLYRKNGGEEYKDKELEEMYKGYDDLLLDYKEVVANFDSFLKNHSFGKGKELIKSEQPFVKPVSEKHEREMWTVDGMTKSPEEWGNEYGIHPTTVKNRMKQFGLSLEQAIKFPKVGNKKKLTAMEQWKAMGLL